MDIWCWWEQFTPISFALYVYYNIIYHTIMAAACETRHAHRRCCRPSSRISDWLSKFENCWYLYMISCMVSYMTHRTKHRLSINCHNKCKHGQKFNWISFFTDHFSICRQNELKTSAIISEFFQSAYDIVMFLSRLISFFFRNTLKNPFQVRIDLPVVINRHCWALNQTKPDSK